jgi:ribosome biogenesis SPOUT family RNA methylase Rps3
MPIFVIEHLEPKLWKWCKFEYENISKLVGKPNLWITNLKRQNKFLNSIGTTEKQRIFELGIDQSKICILDPDAKEILKPEDAKKFDYFIFGGILGDNPPRKRTGPELSVFMPNVEKRHIGNIQMSTDNAVLTTKMIIVDGKKFEDINFVDSPELKFGEFRFLELPYRYVNVGSKENPKPQMSEKLFKFLKNKKGF